MSDPFFWHDSNGKLREQPSVIYPCLLGHYASSNEQRTQGILVWYFQIYPFPKWTSEQPVLFIPPVKTHLLQHTQTHTKRV